MPQEKPNNWEDLPSSEKRDWHQAAVQPPDCRRIAEEAGQTIQELYEAEGLTTYRRVVQQGNSDNWVVEEGYIEIKTLPNGTVTYKEKKINDRPIDWAHDNR